MWTVNKVVVVLYCVVCSILIDKGCMAQCFNTNSRREASHSRAEADSLLGQLPPIFKFRKQDNTSVVKLQFSVPFFKIPVKSTTRGATEIFKELRDINGQWVYSAVTVFTGIGLALGLFQSKHFTIDAVTQFFNNLDSFGGFRGSRSGLTPTDVLIYILQNRDGTKLTHCMQKLVCHLVRQSSRKVAKGKGSNINKLVDGLATNGFVLNILSRMQLKEFIEKGRSARSCSYGLESCGELDEYFVQLSYKI